MFTGFEILSDQYVLITDEKGVIEGVVPIEEAGDDIQFSEGILTPGFVNCHCHLELSHMKGMIPEKTGMTDFLLAVLQERKMPEETIYAAIENAEDEMLRNGIVAVGDICNNTLSLLQKQKGRLSYHNFIEASGFSPTIAPNRYSDAIKIFKEFESNHSIDFLVPERRGGENNSIVPHAPYSVSPELFNSINKFAGNRILSIHSQESLAEEHFFKRKNGDFLRLFDQLGIDLSFFTASGRSSLQTIFPHLNVSQNLILVHNVTTNIEDLDFLKKSHPTSSSLFFCICPNANLYIGNGLPNISLLQQSGFPVVLGTDSLASNYQLSILEEMRIIREHFPGIANEDLFRWATSNGAQALRLDEVLGSFEKGKRPGVILCNNQLSISNRLV